MSSRATSLQLRPGALCHHLATYVWSAVRVVPIDPAEVLDLVELARRLRAAQARVAAALRNCDELWRKNGFTPPTHGVGSSSPGR